MKRYRIKMGDLPLIEEHPAGDLVSLKELTKWLEDQILSDGESETDKVIAIASTIPKLLSLA